MIPMQLDELDAGGLQACGRCGESFHAESPIAPRQIQSGFQLIRRLPFQLLEFGADGVVLLFEGLFFSSWEIFSGKEG